MNLGNFPMVKFATSPQEFSRVREKKCDTLNVQFRVQKCQA